MTSQSTFKSCFSYTLSKISSDSILNLFRLHTVSIEIIIIQVLFHIFSRLLENLILKGQILCIGILVFAIQSANIPDILRISYPLLYTDELEGLTEGQKNESNAASCCTEYNPITC
ncbi:hypothetical [Prochlorococcus marinus str. MIT 9313]|uniref:Uncharacterized protein n=1 Tax=Prochlorococcus marinus (strain MIT 9313) TaxID=74547 RepID=Q7V4X3_PROMM|nr:hypothetical [Prochlorococcus marinus str. MIT 9313]